MTQITWQDDVPFSDRYQDVYYSHAGGVEEARHVYLQGINIEALRQSTQHTVRIGELGFGTGVNFLTTVDYWKKHAGSKILHYVAVDKYPISADDMQKAHCKFSEIAYLSQRLNALYTARIAGLQRIWFAENIILDIWTGDVSEVLPQIQGAFDGFYMDGFSPSKNPEMFSEDVCHRLAHLVRKDCRIATFTVAGFVRKNLTSAGFDISKVAGFAGKRQCLTAVNIHEKAYCAAINSLQKVAIIGQGIAGAACADQLRLLGHDCKVFAKPNLYDQDGFNVTASNVPIASVAPRLSAGNSERGRDIAACYVYALHYMRRFPEVIKGIGAMKVPSSSFSEERLKSACESWSGLGVDAPIMLSAADMSACAMVDLDSACQYMPRAIRLDSKKLLQYLIAETPLYQTNIIKIYRENALWHLCDDQGQVFSDFDRVILACGSATQNLLPNIIPISQVKPATITYHPSDTVPKVAMAGWGGHIIPAKDGFWMGEHQSGSQLDIFRRWSINAESPGKASWSGHKLSVNGHWPLYGEILGQEGLFILAGAGGHGFTLLPMLASHLALMQDGYGLKKVVV